MATRIENCLGIDGSVGLQYYPAITPLLYQYFELYDTLVLEKEHELDETFSFDTCASARSYCQCIKEITTVAVDHFRLSS